MKKITLIFIISIFLISNLIAAEKKTTVFYGYQKTKWGSSPEAVKKNYPNLKTVSSTEKKGVCYEQTKPNNIISYRSFHFYKNELYKVLITFNSDLTTIQVTLIIKKVNEIYGPAHQSVDVNEMMGKFKLKGITYSFYFNNDKMQVDVRYVDVLDTDNTKLFTSYSLLLVSTEIDNKRKNEVLKEEAEKIDDF